MTAFLNSVARIWTNIWLTCLLHLTTLYLHLGRVWSREKGHHAIREEEHSANSGPRLQARGGSWQRSKQRSKTIHSNNKNRLCSLHLYVHECVCATKATRGKEAVSLRVERCRKGGGRRHGRGKWRKEERVMWLHFNLKCILKNKK